MEYTFISAAVQNRWNTWNLRGFMILSLCVQLLLAVVAPYRQRTSNRFLLFVVWSAYLLSDWGAMFTIGLISNAGCQNSAYNNTHIPPDVLAFWAAFLLVHLGGPYNITAFSLEDNALWMRHLLGLIALLTVFLYIFLKMPPNSTLLVPTMLIFLAGMINYGERTRALYLASLDNLKKATTKKATVREQSEGKGIFHSIIKGLVVDIAPDLLECNKSRAEILGYTPQDILRLISKEITLLYELLYTKIKVANSIWGKTARAIANYSTLAAFILFCIAHKHQFHGGNLVITYALFAGVFVIHVANMMTFMTSAFFDGSKDFILLGLEQGIFPSLVILALAYFHSLVPGSSALSCLSKREWSNKMASFNILSCCFRQSTRGKGRKQGFIWNKLTGEKDIDSLLWNSVCKDIKENAAKTMDNARMRELYEARGDQALRRMGYDQLMPYIKDFKYENTLFIWHIATEICINVEEQEAYVNNDDMKMKMIFSKKLSDYMMYLLARRSKLMSPVAGIGHIRYKDTYTELMSLGRKLKVHTMREFCEMILREHANIIKVNNHAEIIEPNIIEENNRSDICEPNIIEENNRSDICEPAIVEDNRSNISEPATEENNHGFSVLKDSCGLVELLRENNNRWEVIYKVWVELLSYAAGHCRADSHARLLSQGSEFITAIWILISLCGIGDQFPVNQTS